MGAIIWFFMEQFEFQRLEFPKQLGVLLMTILVGILSYVLLSLLFNARDLKSLKDIFSKEKISP
jgi:hypothetical protein